MSAPTSALLPLLLLLSAALGSGESRFLSAQTSLTLDTCSQCNRILQLSANMISSRDSKEVVYEAMHALCQGLPEEPASKCGLQLKSYMRQTLKPGEACQALGLCAAHETEVQKLLPRVSQKATPTSAAGAATQTKEQFNPLCTICVMVIRKLETLLPKNMTEDTLQKLMEEVCDLIPKSYKDECDDFVDKYGVEIIQFLLSSAAPHTICTLLHLCLFDKPSPPELEHSADPSEALIPSECESCRTLAALSRLHLGLNVTQSQTSAFLQSVCSIHPRAIPKCEGFTRIYGSRLQKVLGNQLEEPQVCERANLCAASKQLEPLGRNRCSWGPSYWCKDVQTAQKCGNLAFCQRRVWRNK